MAGPDEDELRKIVVDIKAAGMDITAKRDIQDFLGVNIYKVDSGICHLSHPHLINQIVSNWEYKSPRQLQGILQPSPLLHNWRVTQME